MLACLELSVSNGIGVSSSLATLYIVYCLHYMYNRMYWVRYSHYYSNNRGAYDIELYNINSFGSLLANQSTLMEYIF